MDDRKKERPQQYGSWKDGPNDLEGPSRTRYRATVYEPEPPRGGRRHTLLWVLGWLFIFPVPLTILMLRNRKLPSGLRYGIIAAGWIVYLLLGWARTHPAESRAPEPETRVVIAAPTATAKPVSTPTPVQTPRPTATPRPSATPTPTPEPTPVPAGVTPAFKETMDSCEAFFDEYIAFLKTMSEDPTNAAVLMRYASMMLQYSDTMEKLDAIDETQLSPADDAYYLEVMTRIDVKLLQAAQYMQ